LWRGGRLRGQQASRDEVAGEFHQRDVVLLNGSGGERCEAGENLIEQPLRFPVISEALDEAGLTKLLAGGIAGFNDAIGVEI
jgi:hypothetical protein